MPTVLTALVPVFVLILAGWGMRRWDFPGDAFWRPAERLTYYVLFPALLVRSLASAPFAELPAGSMAAALLGGLLGTAIAALVGGRLLRLDGGGFGALFQGSIRFNTYLGLAAAAGLYGARGVTLAGLAIAVLIPLINVLCVAVLSRCNPAIEAHWGRVAGAVVRNPLILACLLGLGLNTAGLRLPVMVDESLAILARAALPLGLLAVGAGLELRGTQGSLPALLTASALKLLLFPLLSLGISLWLGLDALAAGVVVLFSALPGATSAYILARQMGSDYRLTAAILTVETGLSLFTLPLALWLAGRFATLS